MCSSTGISKCYEFSSKPGGDGMSDREMELTSTEVNLAGMVSCMLLAPHSTVHAWHSGSSSRWSKEGAPCKISEASVDVLPFRWGNASVMPHQTHAHRFCFVPSLKKKMF